MSECLCRRSLAKRYHCVEQREKLSLYYQNK
jgi:hypothetical protein